MDLLEAPSRLGPRRLWMPPHLINFNLHGGECSSGNCFAQLVKSTRALLDMARNHGARGILFEFSFRIERFVIENRNKVS